MVQSLVRRLRPHMLFVPPKRYLEKTKEDEERRHAPETKADGKPGL